MEIKNTYPFIDKKIFQRRKIIKLLKWPLFLLALAAPIVNFLIGGPLWSVVAVVGLYMIWHLLLSIDLIEYNRISQFIKFSIYSCIMIMLIDLFLVGGWALEVISWVTLVSLAISIFLLFTDFNRQKQNLFPMFFLILIGLIWATVGLLSRNIDSWILIGLASLAILSVIILLIALKGDFIREFKCRFHLK